MSDPTIPNSGRHARPRAPPSAGTSGSPATASGATCASGAIGVLEERLRRVPWWAWLALFLAVASLMPAVEASGYVRRVGFDTVIFMLLALGLNVVVGWGGLLDLGYIAFFGVGSYMYAIFDSDKFGFHLPTIVAIPRDHDRRRARRASGRPPVATPVGRLPGDRDAVLPRAVRDGRDQRQPDLRPQRHRRRQRDPATSIR